MLANLLHKRNYEKFGQLILIKSIRNLRNLEIILKNSQTSKSRQSWSDLPKESDGPAPFPKFQACQG